MTTKELLVVVMRHVYRGIALAIVVALIWLVLNAPAWLSLFR